MTLSKLIPSLLVAALALGATTVPAEAKKPAAAKAKPIQSRIVVENVDLGDGTVPGTVSGTIAGVPFSTTITNFALELVPDDAATPGVECSVLDLELAPIDIDLLGLHVDTSAICLSITAFEDGGLLGDLLCGLAGGDLPLPLLQDVEDVLPDILNESLAQAQPPTGEPEDICDGECEVLDLAIGPVRLNLLGLEVYLDNCEGGPVQVCVSATEGGGLLGNLLCGLTGGDLLPNLSNLEDLIEGLDLGLTDRQVNRLVRQVRTLLRDGDLSLHDIEKLARFVQRLV